MVLISIMTIFSIIVFADDKATSTKEWGNNEVSVHASIKSQIDLSKDNITVDIMIENKSSTTIYLVDFKNPMLNFNYTLATFPGKKDVEMTKLGQNLTRKLMGNFDYLEIKPQKSLLLKVNLGKYFCIKENETYSLEILGTYFLKKDIRNAINFKIPNFIFTTLEK